MATSSVGYLSSIPVVRSSFRPLDLVGLTGLASSKILSRKDSSLTKDREDGETSIGLECTEDSVSETRLCEVVCEVSGVEDCLSSGSVSDKELDLVGLNGFRVFGISPLSGSQLVSELEGPTRDDSEVHCCSPGDTAVDTDTVEDDGAPPNCLASLVFLGGGASAEDEIGGATGAEFLPSCSVSVVLLSATLLSGVVFNREVKALSVLGSVEVSCTGAASGVVLSPSEVTSDSSSSAEGSRHRGDRVHLLEIVKKTVFNKQA